MGKLLDRVAATHRRQIVNAGQEAESLSTNEGEDADGAESPPKTGPISGDWYPDGRLPVSSPVPHQTPTRDRTSLGKEQSIPSVGAPKRSHPDFTDTTSPASSSSVDLHPGAPHLVPRGQRHRFLMALARACCENGVEQAAILAILKVTNSEYCHPPKRETELGKFVHWICTTTTVSCRRPALDTYSVRLIPRGERYYFLLFVAAACRENRVGPAKVLAILKIINSECCHPPKRESELEKIVDSSGRERNVPRRPTDIEINSHGFIPRGERNHFLVSLARTCRKNRIRPAVMLEILRQANSMCAPPKPESSLKRIVDWISRNRHRGRKSAFTADQLQNANELKRGGKTNREIAKVLYNTSNPTDHQRQRVPVILKYHFGSKKRPIIR
jgi:hypothetical protein